MRVSLLVSLALHGVAAAALVLLGGPRGDAAPPPAFEVGVHADAMPEVERPPELPPVPDAAEPAEPWEFPEETPEPAPIEAPREDPPIGLGRGLPTRIVRLERPLTRPARPAPPMPPVVALKVAPKGELQAPRLREDLSPAARYPAAARRKGLEGTVVLVLAIAADGTVARVELGESSGHEELDRAAEEAAKEWRFDPARLDGAAVAHDVRVPVEFRLADA
jgi:protein TonB